MRTDMAQLLVETPRHNPGERYREHRRKANRDLDSAPTKQGMSRPYFDRKEFGEYFVPLKGFLRKNVGRPWDKVFSELNSALRGGGTVIDHTRLHLFRDFVVLKPHWIDGKAYHPPPWYSQGPTTFKKGEFYVDLHGILREGRRHRERYRHPKPGSSIVRIDEHSAYIKLDGVWYRVWLRSLPMTPVRVDLGVGAAPKLPVLHDIALKKRILCRPNKPFRWPTKQAAEQPEVTTYQWHVEGQHGVWALENFYGKLQYAYRKESISTRTIRREGLDKLKAA